MALIGISYPKVPYAGILSADLNDLIDALQLGTKSIKVKNVGIGNSAPSTPDAGFINVSNSNGLFVTDANGVSRKQSHFTFDSSRDVAFRGLARLKWTGDEAFVRESAPYGQVLSVKGKYQAALDTPIDDADYRLRLGLTKDEAPKVESLAYVGVHGIVAVVDDTETVLTGSNDTEFYDLVSEWAYPETYVQDVSVDSVNDEVWSTAYSVNLIYRHSTDGTFIDSFAGVAGTSDMTGIAYNPTTDILWQGDYNGGSTSSGSLYKTSNTGALLTTYSLPTGVLQLAVDHVSGDVYVSGNDDVLYRYSSTGSQLGSLSLGGAQAFYDNEVNLVVVNDTANDLWSYYDSSFALQYTFASDKVPRDKHAVTGNYWAFWAATDYMQEYSSARLELSSDGTVDLTAGVTFEFIIAYNLSTHLFDVELKFDGTSRGTLSVDYFPVMSINCNQYAALTNVIAEIKNA